MHVDSDTNLDSRVTADLLNSMLVQLMVVLAATFSYPVYLINLIGLAAFSLH
jgi:hypothetical protein